MDRHTARTRGYGWAAMEWLLGILGAVAAFLGLFAMFGNESEYLGLGGDLAWRVGDISSAWMYGLLIGGIACLAGLASMLVAGRSRTKLASTARGDLLWHTAVFVLVNAFLWIQDFAVSTGLDYAYLVTIPWAIGLGIHAWTYYRMRSKTPVEVEVVTKERRELQHH